MIIVLSVSFCVAHICLAEKAFGSSALGIPIVSPSDIKVAMFVAFVAGGMETCQC